MPTTDSMVARGMIFVGLRDSSPYIAADSKPTQDQKAKNKPIPANPATASVSPGLLTLGTVVSKSRKAPSGLSDSSDQPSGPPPESTMAIVIKVSITISVMRNTPRMLAAMLIL